MTTTRWQDVAVGAVYGAEDAAAGVFAGVRRGVARLAERGAAERDRGRRRVAHAVHSLTEAVATAPVVDRVVDHQLDRVLRPLVVTVLDDVLARLDAEPERVQALVRGQRDSMVDELVDRIRTGAADGDAAIGQLTGRVFRRTAQPGPAPVPTEPA